MHWTCPKARRSFLIHDGDGGVVKTLAMMIAFAAECSDVRLHTSCLHGRFLAEPTQIAVTCCGWVYCRFPRISMLLHVVRSRWFDAPPGAFAVHVAVVLQ
jgi:hypothetical protein